MLTARLSAVVAIVALLVVALALPFLKPAPDANADQMVGTLMLYPWQDTWVDEAALTANYGSEQQLSFVRTSGQQGYFDRQSLLQLDLTTLPRNALVLTATLKLYQRICYWWPST